MFSFDISSNFAHLSVTLKKINLKILEKKQNKTKKQTCDRYERVCRSHDAARNIVQRDRFGGESVMVWGAQPSTG